MLNILKQCVNGLILGAFGLFLISQESKAQPVDYVQIGAVGERKFYRTPRPLFGETYDTWLVYANDPSNDYEFMLLSPFSCGEKLNNKVTKNGNETTIARNAETEEWFKAVYDPLCKASEALKISPPSLPKIDFSAYPDYEVTRQGKNYRINGLKGHKKIESAYIEVINSISKICIDNNLYPLIFEVNNNYTRKDESASGLFSCTDFGSKLDTANKSSGDFVITAGWNGMYIVHNKRKDDNDRFGMVAFSADFCKKNNMTATPFPSGSSPNEGTIRNGYGTDFYHFLCH